MAKLVDAAVKTSFASACSSSKLQIFFIEITAHKDLQCLKMLDECSDKLNASQLTAGGFSSPGWDTKSDVKPQSCHSWKQRGAQFSCLIMQF